jgi:hypothetical protein
MSEQEQGWHRYISVKMDRFQDGNARLTSWPLSASEAADLGEGLGCSAASSRASPVVSAVLEASLPLSRTSAATGVARCLTIEPPRQATDFGMIRTEAVAEIPLRFYSCFFGPDHEINMPRAGRRARRPLPTTATPRNDQVVVMGEGDHT